MKTRIGKTHMNAKTTIIAIALSLLVCVGCKESSPVTPPAEQEVITTVTLTLTQTGTTTATQYVWEDIDGTGGNAPNRIDTINLMMDAAYVGTVTVENRSVSPAVNITDEIATLKDQHQFFFTVTNGLATITSTDKDSRNLPVGLAFGVLPVIRGKGELTVALSHWESAIAKDGITPSDETDISVTFPLVVE